jgi:hypothetical protein
MSINRRTYPPMPGGANWPNADAPDSCYAETPEERAAIERLNVLTRKLRSRQGRGDCGR